MADVIFSIGDLTGVQRGTSNAYTRIARGIVVENRIYIDVHWCGPGSQ